MLLLLAILITEIPEARFYEDRIRVIEARAKSYAEQGLGDPKKRSRHDWCQAEKQASRVVTELKKQGDMPNEVLDWEQKEKEARRKCEGLL